MLRPLALYKERQMLTRITKDTMDRRTRTSWGFALAKGVASTLAKAENIAAEANRTLAAVGLFMLGIVASNLAIESRLVPKL